MLNLMKMAGITLLALVLATPAPAQVETRKQAALMEGYPAYDAEMYAYLLRHRGVKVRRAERVWLPTKEYAGNDLVIVTADLARGQVQPTVYSAEDLRNVKAYLEQGGTLLLGRGGAALFSSQEGQVFLQEIMGTAPKLARGAKDELALVQRDHPWLKPLSAGPHKWITDSAAISIPAGKAERVIATPSGYASLARASVGKGRIIYIGWDICRWLPEGRRPSSVEAEQIYDEQVRMIGAILGEVLSEKK
jgi:hypothetical protein